MLERVGDLWREHHQGAVVAITTNGTLTRSGAAIMLRGCAREAKERFPDLPRTLGDLVRQHGNHVFDLGRRLVSFPVEEDPYQRADLVLIERSCRELVELADYKGWAKVVVPRPGCGGGGLSWTDVQPVLRKYFDRRFEVISKGES